MIRRRIAWGAVGGVCLIVSITLIFQLAMLGVGIAGWEGLQDYHQQALGTRVHTYQFELLLLQVVGGIVSALIFHPQGVQGKYLKWVPLFILAFAAFTFSLSWLTALIVR